MTEDGEGQRTWSESATEFVASRRNVLRTATGLAAAAVVGNALADRGQVTMAAAGGTNRITCQIGQLDPFEVLSFSWALSTPAGTGSQSSGAGAGKVTLQDLSFTKYVDAATPKLFQAAVAGDHFNQAVLTSIDASGKTGLALTMKLVIVSSQSFTASESANAAPTENVTLTFGAIQVAFQGDSQSYDSGTGTGS